MNQFIVTKHYIQITEQGMKALDLVKRINAARRYADPKNPAHAAVLKNLQDQLATLEAYKPPKPPKKTKAQRKVEQQPILATSLRAVLKDAERQGKSLGWVMRRFKMLHGRYPDRLMWRDIVGRDTRDAIIDAMVDKAALQARSVRL